MQRGGQIAGEGAAARLIVERVTASEGLASLAAPPSRLVGAEQSNTSIVYGDTAILKFFRRLESGENPEVEIGRFLTTRTAFHNTPAQLGNLRVEFVGGTQAAAGVWSGSSPVPSTAGRRRWPARGRRGVTRARAAMPRSALPRPPRRSVR